MKSLLENWLNDEYSGRWEEVTSNNGGWDVEIDDDQWLIVFRVGIYSNYMDFHFWYRTDRGLWANKHGWQGSGSELLYDDPTDNQSSGWALGPINEFYNSDVIYYVITESDG